MSGSIGNISSSYGHGCGRCLRLCREQVCRRHYQVGRARGAKSGIQLNGVAPGPTDTAMLTRFTSTPENKVALVTGVPMVDLPWSNVTWAVVA
jgi:hypothetical protein